MPEELVHDDPLTPVFCAEPQAGCRVGVSTRLNAVVLTTTSHYTEFDGITALALSGALLEASPEYVAKTKRTEGVFDDGYAITGLAWHSCSRDRRGLLTHWYVQLSTGALYKETDFASMR